MAQNSLVRHMLYLLQCISAFLKSHNFQLTAIEKRNIYYTNTSNHGHNQTQNQSDFHKANSKSLSRSNLECGFCESFTYANQYDSNDPFILQLDLRIVKKAVIKLKEKAACY